ncbi:MAG: preprotein translocase subunit SecE [Clostridia bacterium]|nr:preprotein translocase subunit SecE [Clostridia bacterium]
MAKNEKSKKDKRHFFKDFKAELKKVVWPTKKQLANNTTAVITIVLIVALIVIGLDLAFEAVNKFRVEKLEELIEARTSSEENNEVENTEVSSNEVVEDSEADQDSQESNEE